MSQVIPWPPVRSGPPPQNQYEISTYMGYDCIVSHLEPSPNGPSPHFVVDWTQQPTKEKPYPFLPSMVPSFLEQVWVDNADKNRPNIKHCLSELTDKYWGLPIFVVGTGPSLEKNMHVLTENKKGIIIATNDAINILPKEVKIDYYMVVDGRLPERWWANCKRDLKSMKLISVPLVTPNVTKYFDPDNIYWARFAGEEGPNRCFKDMNHIVCIEPGYVCGFSALHAAFMLGANPVVMVGMDCCLQNGRLHAGDVVKARALPGEEYVVANDIYGTPRVTSSTYMRGMWKMAAGAKLNGRHTHFINATEGGILKDFVDVTPLHEVMSWQK